MKKFVCAAVVACVAFCLAQADEFTAVITKVQDGKVTFKKFKGFNKEEKKVDLGDETTLPATSTVKVTKGKFDKDTKKVDYTAVEGGLSNEMFKNIGEAKKGKGKGKGKGGFNVGGMMATIVTDSSNKNITEIKIGGGGFFGKKKKDQ